MCLRTFIEGKLFVCVRKETQTKREQNQFHLEKLKSLQFLDDIYSIPSNFLKKKKTQSESRESGKEKKRKREEERKKADKKRISMRSHFYQFDDSQANSKRTKME